MTTANPYSTPQASLETQSSHADFQGFKPFSSEGRLGRLRFLVYSFGVAMLGGIIASILFLIPFAGPILGVITYIALLVVSFFLTIQRSHDFNASGWMSVLYLVPLVSLIFFFIPGSKESNQFGNPTPPNSTSIKVVAFILIGLTVLSIVGGIIVIATSGLESLAM